MATQPQRRWQAACPNCGAPVEFQSAASGSAVCSFCRSTLLREGEALRKIGRQAELFEDYSPLQLGVSGRHAGEPFTLIGRLQLAYEGGSWNEWHALFENGRSAWLSEDNGKFVMSFPAELSEATPPSESLLLGQALLLGGQRWDVAALTHAHLGAAEGELPHPPAGEFLIAELRNAQDEVGSLEYADKPQWSVGRAVRLDDLALKGLREASGKTLTSRTMACPSCGAALTPKFDSTQSITCTQCHAVVDISAKEGAELSFFAQNAGPQPLLPLGSQGSVSLEAGKPALPWQIVGYQERREIPEPGDDEANESSSWREYLLYNATEGFAFLVDTDEGWSLVRPLTGAPIARNGSAAWQGLSYPQRWQYAAETTRVLGEFYWRLERGERAEVTDYALGNALLSREQLTNEVTWSLGGYKLESSVVTRAFGVAPGAAPLRADARPSGGLGRNIIIVIVILVVIVLLLRACNHDDCAKYRDNFGPNSAEYQQCLRNDGGRIAPVGIGSGGSWGGFGSGSGGHK